jgi:hypothetical protein
VDACRRKPSPLTFLGVALSAPDLGVGAEELVTSFHVVKAGFIQGDHLVFAALVVGVTPLAVVSLIGVIPPAFHDLLFDRFVANQALFGVETHPHFMALGAAADAVELGVRLR